MSVMNVYEVTFVTREGESYFSTKPILVVAGDYANAEDKALTFTGRDKREILGIRLFAKTTRNTDVFEVLNR